MSNYQVVDQGNNKIIRVDINPYDIIHDLLSTEQRQDLIESMSCHNDIIKAVMEQVLDGYTENGFCGQTSSHINTPIQEARKRIAKESDEAIRRTIEGLEARIKTLEKDVEYWRTECDRQRSYF